MEIGLSVGLPFFLMFAGYALIVWAQGNTKHPKPKKTVGYQIAYNGVNFVWIQKDNNEFEGTLHFSHAPKCGTEKVAALLMTNGICSCQQYGYRATIEISKACDVEQVLQKFIEANW